MEVAAGLIETLTQQVFQLVISTAFEEDKQLETYARDKPKGTKAFFDGVVEFNVGIVDCFDLGIVVSIYVGNANGINVGIINGLNVGIVDG